VLVLATAALAQVIRLLLSGNTETPRGMLVGMIFLILAGCTAWFLVRRSERRGTPMQKDLAVGVAELERRRTKDAIRIEEFEDSGIGFYVRLEDDRILFFQGRYLHGRIDERRFPCTEFDIVRGPTTRRFLGIDCAGSYKPPTRSSGPITERAFCRLPEDGDFVTTEWERLA